MAIGQRCTNCGHNVFYPNKRDYITCPWCRQLVKWKTPQQYKKIISKKTFVPVKEDFIYCKCGCGQPATTITLLGNIREYINGHNNIKDMSDRKCSICKNNKTVIQKAGTGALKRDRPHWFHINSELVCHKCYMREFHNKKPHIKLRRKIQSKSYRQRPEIKERHNQLKRERRRTPQYKEYIRRNRPRINAYTKAYRQRPQVQAYYKSYNQRPEVIKRRREWARKKHNIPPERYRV